MISAFFGLSSRDDSAHAALISANTAAALGSFVSLIRLALPHEASLPARTAHPTGIDIVELVVDKTECVGDILAKALPALVRAGRAVVLDLPLMSLFEPRVASMVEVSVVTMGPTPVAEQAAAELMRMIHHDANPGVRRPWFLVCGHRGGELALAGIANGLTARFVDLGGDEPCRMLPAPLPPLDRRDAQEVSGCGHTSRTRRAGTALLAALRATAEDPAAGRVADDAFARHLDIARAIEPAGDDRDPGERLHDLADELGLIKTGLKPASGDLSDAPRIEDWSMAIRPAYVLSGRAFGHPIIPDGQRVTTSDLYASDGQSWARTLSRYWVLGRGASGDDVPAAH